MDRPSLLEVRGDGLVVTWNPRYGVQVLLGGAEFDGTAPAAKEPRSLVTGPKVNSGQWTGSPQMGPQSAPYWSYWRWSGRCGVAPHAPLKPLLPRAPVAPA